MSNLPARKKKIFRKIWSKYDDTLWKIEQSWNEAGVDYAKRLSLVDSAIEMIEIEKRLKAIETQYLEG